MNYIHKLKGELATAQATIAYYEQALWNLYGFIHTDKFVGVQDDGSRKDWISTGDLTTWILEVRSNVHCAVESAADTSNGLKPIVAPLLRELCEGGAQ